MITNFNLYTRIMYASISHKAGLKISVQMKHLLESALYRLKKAVGPYILTADLWFARAFNKRVATKFHD